MPARRGRISDRFELYPSDHVAPSRIEQISDPVDPITTRIRDVASQLRIIIDTSFRERAAAVDRSGSAAAFGTRLHTALREAVDAAHIPGVQTETSFIKGGEVQYGDPSSVRTDILLKVDNRVVAVWDFKTGLTRICPNRGSSRSAMRSARNIEAATSPWTFYIKVFAPGRLGDRMVTSRQVLVAINRQLKAPMLLGRNVLYVERPIHFARGLAAERSSAKNVVRVRLLRAAFFREFPATLMDYSPRLADAPERGGGTYLSGSADEIARSVLDVIQQSGLEGEFLRSPTAEEFLEIIADQYASPGVLFDRACCTVLIGNCNGALRLFGEAHDARLDGMGRFKPSRMDHAELTLNRQLVTMIEHGEDAAAELRRRCHANALALGFAPSPLPGA